MGGIANTIGGIFGGVSSALTPQNQYNANQAGQNFNSLLSNSQANFAQNQAGENTLASQLQNQANGTGPNPAQMQLQNALTQNQKQAAGQEASQKGINPGLGQKQIMNNSANQAQQAAGQGALMGAQQQLASQQQLGSLYGNMANQNLTNQGQYENTLNAQNGVNAGISAQNAAAVQNTNSGLLGGVAGLTKLLYNGGQVQNFDGGGQVAPNDPVKAKAVSSVFAPSDTDKAIAQAINHPIDTIAKYAGFADGGDVDYNNTDPVDWSKSDDNLSATMGPATPVSSAAPAPSSAAIAATPPSFMNKLGSALTPSAQTASAQPAAPQGASASQQIANQIASQGGVPQWANGVKPMDLASLINKKPMTSTSGQIVAGGPGDAISNSPTTNQLQANPLQTPGQSSYEVTAAHGGQVPSIFHPSHPVMAALKARGGNVPGPEIVKGDSPKNDVVPAVLSAKEIVLPKSITLASNPGDKAKDFVEQIKGKGKTAGGYAKVLEAKRRAMK